MAYGVKLKDYPTLAEAMKVAEKRASMSGQIQGLGFVYRLEDHTYAVSSGYDDDVWYSTGPYLELTAIQIRSKTRCGVTIYEASGARSYRFINLTANKKYACPTIEEALESYIARKTRQHHIHQAKADRALRMMEQANTFLNKRIPPNSLAM